MIQMLCNECAAKMRLSLNGGIRMRLQLSRMHKQFGKDYAHKCGECSNFVSGRYHGRILQKCERYGLTHSEASDWAQKWQACGKFNVPLGDSERPLMEYCKMRKYEAVELDGQLSL